MSEILVSSMQVALWRYMGRRVWWNNVDKDMLYSPLYSSAERVPDTIFYGRCELQVFFNPKYLYSEEVWILLLYLVLDVVQLIVHFLRT